MSRNKERREDKNLSVDKARERHQMHESKKQDAAKAADGTPSEIKCISNFHCNGVEGKLGQVMTKEQLEMIGEKHVRELTAHGCLASMSEPEVDQEQGLDGEIHDGQGEIPDNVELVEEKGS